MNQRLKKQRLFAALFFSSFILFWNTYTTPKSLLLLIGLASIGKAISRGFFDKNFVILLLFTSTYFLISNIDGLNKSETSYHLIFLPALMYAGGKWVATDSDNTQIAAFGFMILGITMASIVIIGVAIDVLQNGFLAGGRSIALPGYSEQEISATVLGGFLIVIIACGGVVFTSERNFSFFGRLLYLAVFIGGLFVALRLGSRTLLAIGLGSIITGFLINATKYKPVNLVVIFLITFFTIYYISIKISIDIDLFNYFQDRIDSDEYGAASAGGRLERWINAIDLLSSNPLGWPLRLNGYSHNFWLDVARNGGWPSLLLSLVITITALKSLLYSVKNNWGSRIYVTTIYCSIFGFMALFFVEPILDGFILVFCAFCFLWGISNRFRHNS